VIHKEFKEEIKQNKILILEYFLNVCKINVKASFLFVGFNFPICFSNDNAKLKESDIFCWSDFDSEFWKKANFNSNFSFFVFREDRRRRARVG